MSIYDKNTGTIRVAEAEPDEVHYRPNNMIATKVIWKKSRYAGRKGWAYFIKNAGWYFRPDKVETEVEVKNKETGETEIETKLVKQDVQKAKREDDIRMPWFYLDCNVEVGIFGQAKYKGINPTFRGKLGTVWIEKDYSWKFAVDGEEIMIQNPDESLELA